MNITAQRGSNLLTPTEVQLFEENFDQLLEDFKSNHNSLSLESLIPILGRPPVLSDSSDNDTRDLAYEERAEYGRKCQQIEELLKSSLN